MDDRIFIDEYPVGDGGYEFGETIDDVQVVDNDLAFQKFCEKLQERFKNFEEELQRTGYLAGKRVAKAIDDTFGIERPNTMYDEYKQGFVVKDEWAAFDYDFTGPKEELEKLEPAEPVYDISWIRKRMKCCKNPMERKQLEKQLNDAYKARKKARKKK